MFRDRSQRNLLAFPPTEVFYLPCKVQYRFGRGAGRVPWAFRWLAKVNAHCSEVTRRCFDLTLDTQLHLLATAAVTDTIHEAAFTADVSSSPSCRPEAETQGWAGLPPPEACLLGMWTAVSPLCPHTGIPLGVSVSPSPLLMRTSVLQDQGPQLTALFLRQLSRNASPNTAPF